VEQCIDLDPKNRPLADFIDVRTGGMGKSAGCHGGWITCTKKYRERLRKKSEQYRAQEDPVFLPAIVGCLYTLLHRQVAITKLHRIRQMVAYARETLTTAGLHVYGDFPSPIVVVYCGSILKTPLLANKALQQGVYVFPLGPPAVPLDQCRIRICITHNHTDYELTQVIHTIIRCAKSVGVISNEVTEVAQFSTLYYNEPKEHALMHKNHALAQILSMIEKTHEQFTVADKADKFMKKDALNLMRRYGLGAGSVRTINGTFVQHVNLEDYIGDLYHGLACLHFYDQRIASFSVIQALARPLNGMKMHTILLPAKLNDASEEGINCIRRTKLVELKRYDSHTDMLKQIGSCSHEQKAITIIVRASALSNNSEVEALFQQVRFNAGNMKAVTIFIDAVEVSASGILGFPCQVNLKKLANTYNARILLLGAFHDRLKLPGAYVVSDSHLVNEFRFAAPGYLYSSAEPAVLAHMIHKSLKASVDAAAK